ncbi:hypothetical protein A2326_03790 [candidate division WWE3 bacterium RIFOXYB2_FULL_41_6]|nr:MAG: hypothetical protein A2326_03790 [candidate division WWE3 bacterium RIFOXYB2_FULL_41_6]
MEKHAGFLDKDKHAQLVLESFRDTLKMLGGFIPQDKLQRLFPGLELADLDSYDFSLAKIKVFVLSNEDYDFFRATQYPGRDIEGEGGFTRPTVSSYPGSFVKTEMQVDVSEKKVIVVRELWDTPRELIEKEGGKLPRSLTSEEQALIARNIKATLIHEFLHDLDVSTDLPKPFKEGVTEWYAQQVANGIQGGDSLFENRGVVVGYKNETEGVSIIMNTLIEGGITQETIDRAFLSADSESRKSIADFLANRYGDEQADKIMNWRFESSRKSLRYIIELESKKDSDIGRFLRTYKS